jgi:hypothetical protein
MRYVILAIALNRQIARLIVEHIYIIAGTRVYGPDGLASRSLPRCNFSEQKGWLSNDYLSLRSCSAMPLRKNACPLQAFSTLGAERA